MEHVRDDAGPALVPVRLLAGLAGDQLAVAAPVGAARALEAEVAALHDIVDADTLVPVVVVVALPDGAEAVETQLVIVAEVVADHVKLLRRRVPAESHAVLEAEVVARLGLAAVGLALAADLAAEGVGDGRSVGVLDVAVVALVAHVEVVAAVGAEDEGVDAVVVVVPAEAGEDYLRLADRLVA